MAQNVVTERPPDPVVHPTCGFCAGGEKPKREDHYGPLYHKLPSPPGEWHENKKFLCPLRNHPLVVKQFEPLSTWEEWRRFWDEAKTYEQLLGLLHVGLNASRRNCEWRDPILFYLAIADGWRDGYSSYAEKKTMLNALKAKAWQVLSMHYWKLSKDDVWAKDSNWKHFATDPKLVDALLDFFLRDSMNNLPRHDSEVSENRAAYGFIEWFVEMLWQRTRHFDDFSPSVMADQKRREQMMRLLIAMGKFDVLMLPSDYLTRADRRFLKRRALSGADPGTTLWQVASGLCGYGKGNQRIAQSLFMHFIKRKERARLDRLARIKHQEQLAENRKKEIAIAAAAAEAATARLKALTTDTEK